MDVKFINPFLTATVNVLKTMAFVEPKPGKPFIKKDKIALGDVTGIIGLSGDVTGTLSITFEENTIKHILSNMFGEEVKEINDEVRDGVGELTNMICGDARKMLQQQGINIKAAIPSIVSGKNHTIQHITAGPVIALPFTTEAGKFVVEFTFKKN